MSARIEALLASRSGPANDAVQSFRWEADAGGTIHWVEGVPRAALIGRTIAIGAGSDSDGADPRIAAAFRQRAPFRDAAFTVAGDGAAAGCWRMAGVPVFDGRSGGFAGFRGSAHRGRPSEPPAAMEGAPATSPDDRQAGGADSVRQLVHELRTPLNAIAGFAEMIDGQHLGPAGAGYRARAAGIRRQAAQLLSAVDDLDLAARAESGGSAAAQRTDLAPLLQDVEQRHAAGRMGWGLRVEVEPDLPPARVEAEVAERLLTRLIGAVSAAAAHGEVLPGWLRWDDSRNAICLCINRPRALLHHDDPDLVDATPDLHRGDGVPWSPHFALRLVRRIAEALGGSLDIHAAHLVLALPAAPREP